MKYCSRIKVQTSILILFVRFSEGEGVCVSIVAMAMCSGIWGAEFLQEH